MAGFTAAQKINRTRKEGGRIIAVGTTVVRALESAVDIDGLIKPQHQDSGCLGRCSQAQLFVA